MQIRDYRRYLAAVNARNWNVAAEYVAHEVSVNGELIDGATYVGNLRRLAATHPDHRWEITDLLCNGDRLAARLTTTCSEGQGFELAHYRWANRRIVEVWTIGTEPVVQPHEHVIGEGE